jgi:DNA-binding transcriptional ArsR family regulator
MPASMGTVKVNFRFSAHLFHKKLEGGSTICVYLALRMGKKEKTTERLTEAKHGMSSAVRRILWWVITGNRGGANRARIVLAIKNQPLNANQLAQRLGMDYKTVRHHLSVLLRNRLILEVGEGYGSLYFLSPELEQNYEEFIKIWEKIGPK